MTDYDITDGGRRRIVSEDQAKNLREHAVMALIGFPQSCSVKFPGSRG